MSKFIITTHEDGKEVRHDEGMEFPSEKAVTDDAQNALADMAKERLPNGRHASFTTKVEDEGGTEIYYASLKFEAATKQDIADQQAQADAAAEQAASSLRGQMRTDVEPEGVPADPAVQRAAKPDA